MAIELVDGSIFLHIPKTGGNWVTQVLSESKLIKRQVGHKHSDFIHHFIGQNIPGEFNIWYRSKNPTT